MAFTSEIAVICLALLAGMLIVLKLGLKHGARYVAQGTGRQPGSTVGTAAFGLLGLMTAFSFYGATGRLDSHRELTVDEANAIGTAYQRIDLLPKDAQPALRKSFAAYVDTRITLYRHSGDTSIVLPGRRINAAQQREIWQEAIAACPPTNCPAAITSLTFSSLGLMFDDATKQTMGTLMHPPLVVFAMLFGIALVCAFLVGFDMAGIKPVSWPHLLAVPLILSVIIFVVLDVEFPRMGMNRLGDFDQLLVTLRQTMPPATS
jgi:hypothetical protein